MHGEMPEERHIEPLPPLVRTKQSLTTRLDGRREVLNGDGALRTRARQLIAAGLRRDNVQGRLERPMDEATGDGLSVSLGS